MMNRKLSGLAVGVACLMFGGGLGCGDSTAKVNDGVLNADFVAIPHSLGTSAAPLTGQNTKGKGPVGASAKDGTNGNIQPDGSVSSNTSFYLAIKKTQLNKKYFLSAYLTQLYPRLTPAAFTLGTRVVSFQVQNGKLFVFDVDDRKKTNETVDPQVIVEAYPIITDASAFNNLPNASQYVLFDPAAGLNKFDVLSDAFSSPDASSKFSVDLMFNQNFRSISDGVTYEQVFTGTNDVADFGNDGSLEHNLFRYSGTMGVAIRKYTEGAQYTPTPIAPKEFFFRSDVKLVPDQSTATQTTVKWNIYQGMKPITWTISPAINQIAQDPRFAQYDVIGAVKAGVENWNQVFGFPVVKAVMGDDTTSPGDDDINFIHVDIDDSFGYAFANWRTNPNTGEIRGASVYFSSLWFEIGDILFTDDPTSSLASRVAAHGPIAKPVTPVLSWGSMSQSALCAMHPKDFLDAALKEGSTTHLNANPALTKKQKVEQYITHVVLHEIGHTLGLRHNFKGSLVPTSSSVMEYIDDYDAVDHSNPGPYDFTAVKYLYGLGTDLPTQPFCTDEDTATDPLCATFDFGADPLDDDFGPTYDYYLQGFLAGQLAGTPNNSLNGVLKFMRAGADSATRTAAWQIATAGFSAPVDPAALAADPTYGARADQMAQVFIDRVWLDDASLRGDFVNDPPLDDAALTQLALTELQGNLTNVDGIRSFKTRRDSVDVLKKFQLAGAYQILTDARASIAASEAGLNASDKLLTDDLLARIDAACTPYFQ